MTDWGIFQVKVVCETRDMGHAKILMEAIKENYKNVHFGEIPRPLHHYHGIENGNGTK